MDSFGSRDSLNDTGITAGNVAAYRKSLESKYTEPNVQIASRKSQAEMKSSTAEIRKSLENLDDRKTTPPPLTKKPIIPIKKSPTVSSVGNIFSGLKQKVSKNVEQRMSQPDSLDGVGHSKINASPVADINERFISAERFVRRDDTEFDQIERHSQILPDMRAQRAKAPKRRLPSTQSSFGESQSHHQNGDSMPVPQSPVSITAPSDNVMKSEEDLTKPKPREWEKNRVPWMDELKASQAKKTSPGIESRSPDPSMHENNNVHINSHKKSNETNNIEVRSSSVDIKSTNDSVFLTSSNIKKESTESAPPPTKSMATKISISESSTASISADETATNSNSTVGIKGRPTSVTLRNVNLPPVARVSKSIHDNGGIVQTSTATITSKTVIQEDGTNNGSAGPAVLTTTVTTDNVCSRVVELELRMTKLEKLVQKQNLTIEELLKSLKDESDKVKNLKHELDKYSQFVTQV